MMRSRISIILLSLICMGTAVVSCFSCTPEAKQPDIPAPDNQDTEDPGKQEEPTEPQPGTYKFVASPLKGTWSAGDRIYVHGNIGTQTEVITLSASDISADGRTAAATVGAEALTSPAEPDGFYAAWPAEAVYQYKGILKTKTTYESCERLLTQAYLKDDTFEFIDVSSLLTFSVDGDYDNWAICSADKAPVCITRFECEYNSASKKFNHKQNDGYPYRYGSLVSGKAEVWFPGDFSFAKGYSIYLGKGDSWTAIYTDTGNMKLSAGEKKDLGNISALLSSYSGLPPKMPRMGAETKYKVTFNELSGICLSENKDFLWGVGDDGELARISFEGEVLWSKYIGGDAEDISLNRDTKDLLIGLEPDGIGVVKGPEYNTKVSTLFNIPAAKNYGNAGIEGCNYYKDGLVFLGAQSNSHIFLCDLETKAVLWEAKLYDKNRVSEIAGFSYDPLTGWLWIIDSEARKVFVFDIDHSVADGKYSVTMDYLGAYPVGGSNPESVCVDHEHSCIWVGDDYGNPSYLYRYEFSGLDDFNK